MFTESQNPILAAKYNVPAPRYTSYPTMPYWDTNSYTQEGWQLSVKKSFDDSNLTEGISLYIHLPFCESLCTYCGCNTRITKNHDVEVPYILAVLKEWEMYCELLSETAVIREIHLGGGTPTFFSAENLDLLIYGLLDEAIVHPEAEFSFEGHPGNTTESTCLPCINLVFAGLAWVSRILTPGCNLLLTGTKHLTR